MTGHFALQAQSAVEIMVPRLKQQKILKARAEGLLEQQFIPPHHQRVRHQSIMSILQLAKQHLCIMSSVSLGADGNVQGDQQRVWMMFTNVQQPVQRRLEYKIG